MPILKKDNWYINRLRRMSIAEISYRVKNIIIVTAQKTGLFIAREVPEPDIKTLSPNIFANVSDICIDEYRNEADRILSGRLDLFSLKNIEIGIIPDWNQNVMTGEMPPMSFGKTLDYRNQKLVGDIKYIWGQNRHLHLVTIAQAYHLTRDRRYLNFIETQLNSWFDQCPYMKGPNWTSALELSIRLINWALIWNLIGGIKSPLFEASYEYSLREKWLKSIYQHVHFINSYYSRYSSANNHLLGELAGVFIATTVWPYWPKFISWQESSFDELVEQTLIQNGSDGVNHEQSTFYQHFVLDFLIIAGLTGKHNNYDFPDIYWDRIEKMLEFIASIMDLNGHVPMIGDGDDGLVIRLSLEKNFCIYRSLLATGAVLFSRNDFKKKSGCLDNKTRWLLGQDAHDKYTSLKGNSSSLPVHRDFPNGGYYILGKNFETKNEVRLIVDSGALGYLSIAAHGHADALAFLLSIGGREVLIDPGTYVYQSNKEWRNYFRGTSAHNTVRIDKQNQSQIGGNFMWLDAAEAKCELWEIGDKEEHFVGSHNGYARLHDPVLHTRDIRFNKIDDRILITDKIKCTSTHYVERYMHFSEQCNVSLLKNIIFVAQDCLIVRFKILDQNAKINLLQGNETPCCGWVSRSFNVKNPTTTAVITNVVTEASDLVMEITYEI